MNIYISPAPEEQRIIVSALAMKHKGGAAGRRFPFRLLPTVLFAGVLLPFLFIRSAFVALDDRAAAICHGCLGWKLRPRLLWGSDASQELGEELKRVFLETAGDGGVIDQKVVEAAPDSWDQLVSDMMALKSYEHLDVKSFALEAKAMIVKMDQKVQWARLQTLIYRHLASVGIPKSIHCLTLELAQQYTVNALARSSLPPPEIAHRLTDASYVHIALFSDNVLAASVVVSSTVASSDEPENYVFHIITDKKTYTAMHTWFALHQVHPAIVEVKGLHQFDWPSHVRANIMDTIDEIHRGSVALHFLSGLHGDSKKLQSLRPGSFSILNNLRMHLPDLFPKLEKVILLDDDVVVQRDLTPLWYLDLNGNVNAAVSEADNNGSYRRCVGKKLSDFLNFSNLLVSSQLRTEGDQCSWLGGLNIYDLQAWRGTNITDGYQQWLKLNRESGYTLSELGSLPAALVAFDDQIQPIDPSWHLPGLGMQIPEAEQLESAAVLHFSGPMKPWLDIGFPELRKLWQVHVNRTDEFVKSCRVME